MIYYYIYRSLKDLYLTCVHYIKVYVWYINIYVYTLFKYGHIIIVSNVLFCQTTCEVKLNVLRLSVNLKVERTFTEFSIMY